MTTPTISAWLVADGSSDKALIAPLEWLLREHTNLSVRLGAVEFGLLPRPPRTLSERVAVAAELFPADLFFFHRDAERTPHQTRVAEILAALPGRLPGAGIPVVPVRMTEAWLLIDASAIRTAAGNPNGRVQLSMPALRQLEQLPDPKRRLYDLLRQAGDLGRRRRQRQPVRRQVHQVARLIGDFSPLRQLRAFADLEQRLHEVCRRQGWS